MVVDTRNALRGMKSGKIIRLRLCCVHPPVWYVRLAQESCRRINRLESGPRRTQAFAYVRYKAFSWVKRKLSVGNRSVLVPRQNKGDS
jgi:hypothetical protein